MRRAVHLSHMFRDADHLVESAGLRAFQIIKQLYECITPEGTRHCRRFSQVDGAKLVLEGRAEVVAFYWTVRKFWREFDGCSGCDKNRQKTVERFQAEEWFHAEVSGDCAAAAGSCGCKVIVLLRQHCSASERRMNKSEYASVIMVLLRRINEFTATQKNTHGHEQLGLLALRADVYVLRSDPSHIPRFDRTVN